MQVEDVTYADGCISKTQANFYKTFTRPVLKVLLMATLTYQIAYVSWMKLEQDEIKEARTEEVAKLEAKVDDLQKQQIEHKKS